MASQLAELHSIAEQKNAMLEVAEKEKSELARRLRAGGAGLLDGEGVMVTKEEYAELRHEADALKVQLVECLEEQSLKVPNLPPSLPTRDSLLPSSCCPPNLGCPVHLPSPSTSRSASSLTSPASVSSFSRLLPPMSRVPPLIPLSISTPPLSIARSRPLTLLAYAWMSWLFDSAPPTPAIPLQVLVTPGACLMRRASSSSVPWQEREINAISQDLEKYRQKFQGFEDQKRLLYREYVREWQTWRKEKEGLQGQVHPTPPLPRILAPMHPATRLLLLFC